MFGKMQAISATIIWIVKSSRLQDYGDRVNRFLNSVDTGDFAKSVIELEHKFAEDVRKKQRRAEMFSRIKSIFGGLLNA